MSVKILNYGESGVGKTIFAATAPKPIVFLDFDNGLTSIRDKKTGLLPEGVYGIPMYRMCLTPLQIIRQAGKDTPPHLLGTGIDPKVKGELYNAILALQARLNNIIYQAYAGKISFGDGTVVELGDWGTLVPDSITSLAQIIDRGTRALGDNPTIRIQDYGTMKQSLLGEIIPSLKGLPCNVVVIAHEDVERNKTGGIEAVYPRGTSIGVSREFAESFDEVYRQSGYFVPRDGSFWTQLQTTKDAIHMAKSRLGLPPTITPATWQALEKYLPKPAKAGSK